MKVLRASLFALFFYPGTLVYVLAGMVASLFGTAPMRAVVLGWADFHAWLSRNVAGVTVRIEGELPPGQHLIAVKHQSMFETIEILRIAPTPIIVLKRELADMPLFGWMTRCWGMIRVDREAGASAVRNMLASAKAARESGRPVAIFPEGTRVAEGQTPALGAGFAGLYRALGLPVVPIAMNSGRVWGASLPKAEGIVTFKVGETIPAGLKREEVEAKVHAAINALEISAPQPRA